MHGSSDSAPPGHHRYLSVSTVIQKFLSTEHMPLLKIYMERVAATPAVMRPAYAAVLLSLYVQLRDGAALRRFIDSSIDRDHGYKWDVDDAISTCLNGATPSPHTQSPPVAILFCQYCAGAPSREDRGPPRAHRAGDSHVCSSEHSASVL